MENSHTKEENPFLFLQPYGLKDNYALKGRDKEATSLVSLLKWKNIIVVFGKSGIGKTSFINHTLSAKINRVSWLPIRITRMLNINDSLIKNISNALKAEAVDDIRDENIEFDGLEKLSEISSVQLIKELYEKWNRPVYLIIDQLEELFLIGSKEEQDKFLRTLQELMDTTNIQKKIILVLREEHLGYIQEIERILTGVFQDALVIKEINPDDADKILDSLLDAANPDIKGSRKEFAEKISSKELKKSIVNTCISEDKFDAQKLQILLFILWEKIFNSSIEITTTDIQLFIDEFGNSTYPLNNYLDKVVNKDLSKNARLLIAPYWFLLRRSISEANTKMPVSLSGTYNDLLQELKSIPRKRNSRIKKQDSFQVTKKDLLNWYEKLVEKRIMEKLVGIETNEKPEEYFFQLKHDTLVSSIKLLDPKLSLRFPKKNVFIEEQIENPYQGLKQYDYNEEDNKTSHGSILGGGGRRRLKIIPKLYGRETVIVEYVDFLMKDENKCLVVVGDSGTGKSSLVKGGLLPAMRDKEFNIKTLQPGSDLDAFKKEIINFVYDRNIKNTDFKYDNFFRLTEKKCLYIDQFEECYTFREATISEKESFDNFLDFINKTIDESNNNFKLIVSIRHDYAHEFDRNIGQWRKFKKLLRYPNQEEILDIIVSPAYEKGVSFAEADLPEKIAADAANTSYFLPLLSFAMQTLYKYEVADKIINGEKDKNFFFTAARYDAIGGIVKCLQNEFTKTYNELSEEDKYLFPQLMARMIVIKDTIPKAQPLAISRINYAEAGKADKAQAVLNKFVPDFFREREILLDGSIELCYEPIHDSLLIYCDEIRKVVNNIQLPGSQMYLQPRLESATRELKRVEKEMQVDKINKALFYKRSKIIEKRYRELEPLFGLLYDQRDNWLFKEEIELVAEAEKFSNSFKDTEKIISEKNLQEELHISKERLLREENLRVELLRSREEAAKKQQELLARNYKSELESQRRKKTIITLASFLFFLSALGTIWYQQNKTKTEAKNSVIKRLHEDSIKLVQKGDSLFKAYVELDNVSRLNISQTMSLVKKDSINSDLIQKLNKNETELINTVKDLQYNRDKLTIAGKIKDTALKDKDIALNKLNSAYESLQNAFNKIDSLKNVRLIILAELYKKSSPTLSYRLAEEALKVRPNDSAAAKIKSSLATKTQYFESLILSNIISYSLSKDLTRIVTVEKDKANYDKSNVKVWNSNGSQDGKTISVNGIIKVADISADNNKILLATENSIQVLDRELNQPGNFIDVPNLLYSKFAETGNCFFVISKNKIEVDSIRYNYPVIIKTISFESPDLINNARLSGKSLILITSKGILQINIEKGKKSTRQLPQSFITNGLASILSIEAPSLFQKSHDLLLFDSTLKKKWSVKVPDKNFDLISSFVSSPDGRSGIIQFAQKEQIVQFAQQQQQQQQQVQQSVRRKKNKNNFFFNENYSDIFFVNLSTGKLVPFLSSYGIRNGSFILSRNADSVFEFKTGSINKCLIENKKDSAYFQRPASISIGTNTRFKKIDLAGPEKELIISLDDSGEMKLWRYGNAHELDKNGQMWIPSIDDLEKAGAVP